MSVYHFLRQCAISEDSVPFCEDGVPFFETSIPVYKGPLDAHGLLFHPLHNVSSTKKQTKLSQLEFFDTFEYAIMKKDPAVFFALFLLQGCMLEMG